MKKEIYLIRHGQTDYNLKGIIQGRGIDSSINETGRLQAAAFHKAFGNISFDKIYTSTLQRTRQTIEPFTVSGYAHTEHAGLDEMHWGLHEGKSSTAELRTEYANILKEWQRGNLDFRMPEGESPNDLKQRQLEFIDEALNGFEGKMLVCLHGRAMRSLLCCLTQKPLQEMDSFPHANVSLYKLNFEKKNFEIELFNYTEHLKGI